MALRTIRLEDDPCLYKRCREVDAFNERLSELIDDMFDTMYAADGAGLAAPQVGILKRAVVVDVGDHLYELVNPEIISREGEQTGPEGCLSVPGRAGVVKRPMKVVVRAQNNKGEPYEVEAEGFLARAMCHEIDHLDGILYLDIMDHEIFRDEEEDDGTETAEEVAAESEQPDGEAKL